jgi:hypothetical protein
MSRSDGRAANGGRRVLNEGEVLDGIKSFLAERGRGEELVVFNPNEFESPAQLFSWFSQNVAAVIGPHGGAMINHRWFVPSSFNSLERLTLMYILLGRQGALWSSK